MRNDVVQRALREVPLIAALYLAYAGGRVVAARLTGPAFDHAESVWSFERWLHLPSEHSVQQAALHWQALVEFFDSYYAGVHFPATVAALVWLFVWHPERYPWFRRTLAWLTGFALVGHVLYPLAPPRMLAGHGIVDTAHVYGQSVYGPVGTGVANQFAAMPSLHVAWAVLVALAVVRVARGPWRWLAVLHPVTTVAVVIVTGNHYWLDAVVGCALLVLALAITRSRAFTVPVGAVAAAAARTVSVAREHAWPMMRFVVVGGASTLLSVVIFVPLLALMPSAAANTVAAIISTLASNEANRSWVFRSDRGGLLPRVAAAGTVLISYVATTGSLLVLDLTVPHASATLELTVMLAASAVAGLARYVLLGLHIFPSAPAADAAGDPLEAAGAGGSGGAESATRTGGAVLAAHGAGSPARTQSNALSMASSSAP
ncbi:putative membrane protein [Cryptosporangium arvum DSM 44712]|uniref:Putative membrane protein n=1 Tax=Cryptosporangium arvum DSM 44712 TaxID=927661 RepID=A0A011AFH7_9ACTN|nr:putative membrane protein [Cryptosporangium arvum DSM 44712]